MKISDRGINLIKKFESFEPEPYICPAGVLTIGYGTTRNVEEGLRINEAIAKILLKHDLEWVEETIKDAVTVPLSQNQYDALCSFVYNIGATNFLRSTLLRKINNNDSNVSEEFLKWVYSKGIKLKGLENRRKEEKELYDSGT